MAPRGDREMVSVTVVLTKAQHAALRELAVRRNVSSSIIMRELFEHGMRQIEKLERLAEAVA